MVFLPPRSTRSPAFTIDSCCEDCKSDLEQMVEEAKKRFQSRLLREKLAEEEKMKLPSTEGIT